MAKSLEQLETEKSLDLKDPAMAAFLAWLIPGLGHLYQGRTAKAVLFFLCIMGTFVYGLSLGSSSAMGWGHVVYFSWRHDDKRLQYLCQVGVGLPALPAMVQSMWASDGKKPLWGGFMAPPPLMGERKGHDGFTERDEHDQPTLHTLNYHLARYFELGTVYTMIAGLLNILAIYDAWGGPVFMETVVKDEEDKKKGDKKKDDEKEASPDNPS